MSPDDAKQILQRLKILFPAWYAWFISLDTRKATAAAWTGALESQEVRDCDEVLTAWVTGKTKCPETYERDRVVYLLVEAARTLRNARTTKEAAKIQVDSYDAVKQQRRAYNAIQVRGMAEAGRRFAELVAEVNKPLSQWGDDDLAAYRERCDVVVQDFMRRYGG